MKNKEEQFKRTEQIVDLGVDYALGTVMRNVFKACGNATNPACLRNTERFLDRLMKLSIDVDRGKLSAAQIAELRTKYQHATLMGLYEEDTYEKVALVLETFADSLMLDGIDVVRDIEPYTGPENSTRIVDLSVSHVQQVEVNEDYSTMESAYVLDAYPLVAQMGLGMLDIDKRIEQETQKAKKKKLVHTPQGLLSDTLDEIFKEGKILLAIQSGEEYNKT